MAIEIKIHPLDFEKDVAIGIDLPMISEGAFFKLNYTSLDQAVANAKNLLLTNKGERIMLPNFGCDVRKIVFENIDPDLSDKMDNLIRSEFNYWLPYIFINELQIDVDQDRHRASFFLKLSLEGNKFDTRSITIDVINNI